MHDLEALAAALAVTDPHPDFLAATRPTPAQVADAAARNMGWYPAAPLLYPAVPADRGGV